MITKRDQDIINFLESFHIATTSQIHRLFFAGTSDRYTRKRLKHLFDKKLVKRDRSTINNDYAYYIERKPCQVHHDLLRTEIYTQLKQQYNVLEWNNEYPVMNIRPDSFAYISDHGIPFPVFIEIHLNNKFNFDKYKELLENADLKAIYGIMPRVIIVTVQEIKVPNIGIKFKVINLDMKGLEAIFK